MEGKDEDGKNQVTACVEPLEPVLTLQAEISSFLSPDMPFTLTCVIRRGFPSGVSSTSEALRPAQDAYGARGGGGLCIG